MIKKKVSLILTLLTILTVCSLPFLIKVEVHAESIVAGGSDFNLYFPMGSNLTFQHLKFAYSRSFTASVKVASGTVNGTDANLVMYSDSGEMTFTSQDNATLIPSQFMAILVNGTKSNTIKPYDQVRFVWSGPPLEPLFPIIFMVGMIGLTSMFVGPLYAIYQVKHHEYYEGFRIGLIVTVVGIALFIAWLWVQ